MEFVQEGIATLHDFGEPRPDVDLDRVAVVVPIMGTDVNDHLRHVLGTLSSLAPGRVVLCVRGSLDTLETIDTFVHEADLRADVLWCNAPGLKDALSFLEAPAGKGRDVWLGLGIAAAEHEIVVVHDADARTYAPNDVPRLAWPIATGYSFAKGYYARIEHDRLYGRLVRLLWAPLIDVLRTETSHPLVSYLGAFRYPLAGEFALSAANARAIRPYPRWGLEAGMLTEMFERVGGQHSAQVDLGIHRHDHRPVEGADGLARMAEEVTGAVFDGLARHGIELDGDAIATAYERSGERYVDQYAADAAFNELSYDAAAELDQVRTYREAVAQPARDIARLPAFDSLSLTPEEIVRAGRTRTRRVT